MKYTCLRKKTWNMIIILKYENKMEIVKFVSHFFWNIEDSTEKSFQILKVKRKHPWSLFCTCKCSHFKTQNSLIYSGSHRPVLIGLDSRLGTWRLVILGHQTGSNMIKCSTSQLNWKKEKQIGLSSKMKKFSNQMDLDIDNVEINCEK